jgi:hypothetical protein
MGTEKLLMTVEQIQEIILWLRKERIAYSSLSIGDLMLYGVTDLKLADSRPAPKTEAPRSAWERYGGDLLNKRQVDGSEVPDEATED